MSWEKESSELLHQGPFLNLHRDSVIRPDGSSGTYEHVVTKDSVRVVALDEKDRILLVEDDFYLQGRRVLHLPGGGTDGQDPHQAAARELEEETGWIPGDMIHLASIDPLPGITAARVHLFAATWLRLGRSSREGSEINMSVHRMTLGGAVRAVRSGEITEAGSVTAILLAANLKTGSI